MSSYSSQISSPAANSNPNLPAMQGQSQHQHQHQPRPRLAYYLVRTNSRGALAVPLIPADELPYNVRLQGVPRVLNDDQTFGMEQVGVQPYTGLFFKPEEGSPTHRSTSQPPNSHARTHSGSDPKPCSTTDTLARQALVNTNASSLPTQQSLPSRPVSAHEVSADWRKSPASDPQSIIDAIVATKSGAEVAGRIGYVPRSTTVLPPSGTKPDENKKEFCTHWIRTGECDYTQQGCLYKHEMPDRDTLGKIGFRDVPRWWQEKNQAVKIGGAKSSVGPVVKPSVWLQSNGNNDDSDSEDASSERSESSKGSVTSATSRHARKVPPQLNQTPPRSLSHANGRKESKAEDLISFEPLIPTSSPSTTALNSVVSSQESLRSTEATLTAPSEVESEQFRVARSSEPTKIFVPAGESAQKHIAEAKKSRSRNASNRSRATNGIQAQPLDKQIQILQKNKYGEGLLPSKDAVPARSESTERRNRISGTMSPYLRAGGSRKRVPAGKKVAAE